MSRLDIPEFDHGLSKKEIRDLLCPPGELTDPPVVVEIGAHYGEDSYYFLETFEEIELYCFEPDPRNIEMIKKYYHKKIPTEQVEGEDTLRNLSGFL